VKMAIEAPIVTIAAAASKPMLWLVTTHFGLRRYRTRGLHGLYRSSVRAVNSGLKYGPGVMSYRN
jgi:hypothetical protein